MSNNTIGLIGISIGVVSGLTGGIYLSNRIDNNNWLINTINKRIVERTESYKFNKWMKGEDRPKRIILVRHGQTHGYSHTCDCSAAGLPVCAMKAEVDRPLTEEGKLQALRTGLALQEIIGNESVTFLSSPYKSCKQTFQYISGSFNTKGVMFVEEPRLRNQDFGDWHLSTPPEKKEEYKLHAKKVGKFYYRWEGGESPADVYDRTSSVIEMLYRKWQNPSRPENYVLITHSVCIQAFLMRWFRWDVDTFNRMHRIENGQVVIMEKQKDGSYLCVSKIGFDGKIPEGIMIYDSEQQKKSLPAIDLPKS